MLDLFNNKTAFLNKSPRIGWILIISLLCILLFMFIYMCKKEIYDSYQARGVASCNDVCTITTAIPFSLNFEQIILNNKNLDYELISKELKIDEANYLSYYEITLSVKESLLDGEIVNLNFYYNKQKIITKIKEKMF